MALALNKLSLPNATSNTAGAYLQTTTIVSQDTNTANTAVTAGMYILFPANVTVQAYNGSAWANVIAANTGGVLFSDGKNVRFLNGSNANITVTLLTVNGGEAATGQYNS